MLGCFCNSFCFYVYTVFDLSLLHNFNNSRGKSDVRSCRLQSRGELDQGLRWFQIMLNIPIGRLPWSINQACLGGIGYMMKKGPSCFCCCCVVFCWPATWHRSSEPRRLCLHRTCKRYVVLCTRLQRNHCRFKVWPQFEGKRKDGRYQEERGRQFSRM